MLPLSTIDKLRHPDFSTFTYCINQSELHAYRALPDGSLLNPLYTEDLINSNARLFGGSALLTLHHQRLDCHYILCHTQLSSIKDKSLFYLLLVGQGMGPATFASLLIPCFSRSANCTVYG